MVDALGYVLQSILALGGGLTGTILLGKAVIKERDRRRDARVDRGV